MEPNISILELIANHAGKVLETAAKGDELLHNFYHFVLNTAILCGLNQGYNQIEIANAIDEGGNKAAFKILKEKGLTNKAACDIIKKINEGKF